MFIIEKIKVFWSITVWLNKGKDKKDKVDK